MIETQLVLAVKDVQQSSEWYQKLLNCQSSHGGSTFEILSDEKGSVILNLHRWGEHHHPTLTNPAHTAGNGFILYFLIDDLLQIWNNAKQLRAQIEEEPQLNPNSGRQEFSLRDPDGYYISIAANDQ